MAETVVGKATVKESVPGFQPVFDSTVSHKDQVTTNADKWKLEGPLRYSHLAEGDRKQADSVLRGWCPLEALPEVKPRIIRVFISSTFTDMANERNRLMESIYPKLKAYCRERYGVEFQYVDMRWGVPSELDLQEEASKNKDGRVVDMRWGVPSDAWKNHATTELCLKEIRNCAKNSLGPHFILFLGQRNGSRTLPASMPMAQYEAIRAALRGAGVDVTLLDQWYLKDSNYQPPVYILQPIDLILGDDASSWNSIYVQLDQQLLQGAETCVTQGTLQQDALDRLKASVTSLEVMEAFQGLADQEECDRQFLTFMRTITDLESKLDREKAAHYSDQQPSEQDINRSSKRAVDQLKNHVIKKRLSSDNIYEGQIKWIDPHGVDPRGHDEYLNELSNSFYEKTRNLIDMNVALNATADKDDMYDDVLQHWETTKEKCEKFMGREDVLDTMKEYLLGMTDEPLILHGQSGHGKTSIMAKAASSLQGWLQEDGRNIQTTIAVRYCGTSPESSNIRALLPSLCHQLAYTTDRFRHEIPNTYKHVKKYFMDFVTQGEFRGLVVIFLDALDQLSPNDGAHKMDWLPAKIANNVKIIVTTLPEHILTHLKSKITNENQYIKVDPLDPKACSDILDCWIRNAGKALQFRQWQLVRQAFESCSLPLFIQLTFEKVLSWHSYQEAENLSLNHCVNTSINALFDRLESRYGKILVAHALAYLTASCGLSEAEMDDILSLDDVVLNGVFVFWEPPIRRTPPMLWQRIRHDLSSYLVEREDSDMNVMFWYHRQFIEVACARYLSDPAMSRHIHGTIADYLLGTWSGTKKKPFLYEPLVMERLEKVDREGEAIRYVPDQPLIYTTFNTSKRYNLRKLNHLPYQLAKAERLDELKSEVYFNYEWLSTKLEATSVQNVIADYNLVEDKETTLVGDALRMCESALSMDPKVLGIELTGRLLPHTAKHDKIRWLVRQCDIAAVKIYGIIPNWQIYSCPGGPLQYICEAEASINSSLDVNTIEGQDRVLLTAKPANSERMRVWDITQGEPRLDIKLQPGSNTYPTLDGQFLTLFKRNKSLQIYRVESGELCGDVSYGNGVMQQNAVGNKYAVFTLKQAVGPCVVDIEARSLIHRFQYQSDSVAISADDRYMLCNSGQLVAFHEFPLMERKCLIQVPDLPLKLVFHRHDSRRFFALFKNNELRSYKMDLVHKTNKSLGVLHDTDLKDVKVSHTNTLLLARALRCLFVFNIDETCQYKLRYRVVNMPSDVFQEKLSTFKEACFTPGDKLLVAGRHTYLGIWNADNGEPLRLLQTTVSPIVNVFTSSKANKVITVLQDNLIQVWNLDNLYEDVNHCSLVVKGSVKSLSIASRGHRVVACGSQYAEARVLDLETGQTEQNLVHLDDVRETIRNVHMSPQGSYCVTQCRNTDVEDYQKPWDQLSEDKLWDVANGELLFTATRVRGVVFSGEDEKVVFFRAKHYSTYDPTVRGYEAVAFHTITRKSEQIELPEGVFVGVPVVLDQGRYLAMIIQLYSEQVRPGSSSSAKRVGYTRLCVYSFEGNWHGVKQLALSQLWSGVDPADGFLNIRVMNGDNLLVIYMKGVTSVDKFTPEGKVDLSAPVKKGALIYNIRSSSLIRRLDEFLADDSNVDLLQTSRNLSIIMDQRFRFFDVILNELQHKMTIPNGMATSSATLLMDGRYIAVISESRREVLIFRCKDGVRKSGIFVHGQATTVHVGGDDRTLVIGCSDGRVMVFTALFEHPDPVGELVTRLSSRRRPHTVVPCSISRESTGLSTPLSSDFKSINITRSQLQQLSVAKQQEHEEARRKPPSFKAVSTGVMLVQKQQKLNSSRACSIQ